MWARASPSATPLIYEFGQNLWFGFLAIGVYLASWTGWFLNDTGSYRHWLADQGQSETPVIGALVNWWQYHLSVLQFHEGLSSEHAYQSWPWQWLFDLRPVVFYWSSDVNCGVGECAGEVLLLGTPLLWWTFVPATLALLTWALYKRDWRAWFLLAGIGAGILPWFAYPERTMFFFYTAPAVPFFIGAVTWGLGMIVGRHRRGELRPRLPGAPPHRRPDRRGVPRRRRPVLRLLLADLHRRRHPPRGMARPHVARLLDLVRQNETRPTPLPRGPLPRLC